MTEFDIKLQEFDLQYFSAGNMDKFRMTMQNFMAKTLDTEKNKIDINKAIALSDQGQGFILDVRTKEEVEQVKFGFAVNIPLHELPNRLNEIPTDQTIAIFCAAATRAKMAVLYLQERGYANVKFIPESHGQITETIKPGSVWKRLKRASE